MNRVSRDKETSRNDLGPALEEGDATHVLERGRSYVYFGGCDYYRLSQHPAVHAALNRGLQRWGLNVAASRKTTGNHILYGQLESALAGFFRAERAVLLSNGYVTSLAVGQALAGEYTHVLLDQKAHVCLREAALFLACPIRTFEHRNAADLQRRMGACGRHARPIILTDGMFAQDGSAAPLRAYLKLLPRGGALLVDDAHGAGVLGKEGRGTLEQENLGRGRIIQTITLSKAFGVYGGAVLGSRSLQKKLVNRSHLLAGNTPLPLPLVAAALKALELYQKNEQWRIRLRRNACFVKDGLRRLKLPWLETPGPIIFWPVRHAKHERTLTRALRAAGIYPACIRYPGGPASGYFRFAISSAHRREQLERLVEVLLEDGGKVAGVGC